MSNDELKLKITELVPAATFDETGTWLSVTIDAADWLPLAAQLKTSTQFQFDFLFCVTAVDWKTHLSVVYHMRSTKLKHTLVVKAKIADKNNPVIESVSGIWKTAEFHEREAFDLMGIQFQNHPDLRRLFLADDWSGYPLRKDYEDAVNMIKL